MWENKKAGKMSHKSRSECNYAREDSTPFSDLKTTGSTSLGCKQPLKAKNDPRLTATSETTTSVLKAQKLSPAKTEMSLTTD